MSTPFPFRTACIAAALLAFGPAAAAQPVSIPAPAELVSAGSEWERYLRALQVAGDISVTSWSIRSLGPAQLAMLHSADSTDLWNLRHMWGTPDASSLAILTPEARVAYNSAFPYGFNDGAVWKGRGATIEVSAGAATHLGPLTVVMAPTYFLAENRGFLLMPHASTVASAFADGRYPTAIDQPQRFGESAYGRLDWGQSTVRIDKWGAAAGVSNANHVWGPAVDHPVIMGNNAPGFMHAFVGTSHPIDVWIGRIHGKIVWGELKHSDYASITDDRRARRFGSGIVGSFSPRGVDGLELGFTRFFHTPWPEGGITGRELGKPFEGILKQTLSTPDRPDGDVPDDNQLASVFARWVFPRSGFEVYGEYGREDHNWDARDFWLQPDHISAYTLGLQRTWRLRDHLVVGRGEVLNSRISTLRQIRGQSPMYIHGRMTQGHTSRGQVLGSPGTFGGGASTVAADVYGRGGRITLTWARVMRSERLNAAGMVDPSGADVMQAFGVDGLLFKGAQDLIWGVTAVQNLNRDFDRDEFNLHLSLGARARW